MRQKTKTILEPVHIDSAIYLVRGERVILDSDLAKIYGIPTFRLNEAVKRNRNRIPEYIYSNPTIWTTDEDNPSASL